MVGCGEESKEDKHMMCKDCTTQYISNLINDKKKITCVLNDKCDAEYSTVVLEKILDAKLLSRYKEYKSVDEATKLATMLDNYHICPFCSKYGVIIENVPYEHANNIKTIQCQNPDCVHIWCIKCRKGYHGTEPCNKIYHADADKIKRIIDELIDEQIIHKCPKCYTKYNKEDGCNLMTCPSCHAYSCYLCNQIIIPENGFKYHHFHRKGATCPLYNTTEEINPNTVKKGNIGYNNKKVIDAFKKLIELNADNPQINLLIVKEIVSRGYKGFTVPKIPKPLKKVKLLKAINPPEAIPNENKPNVKKQKLVITPL
jgi:TRIAD3 protein (E3 ubiquitin-protein ligase RNF216)